jgi:hypothetical protein
MILGWLKEKLEDFVKSHKRRRPRRKKSKKKVKKRSARRSVKRSKRAPKKILKNAVPRKMAKAPQPATKAKITVPNLTPLRPPASLVAKKSAPAKPAGVKAGTITHFFTQIRVAVVRLDKPLLTGEVVEIRRQEIVLGREKIISMQINHIPVESAKKGEEVGMKISLVVKPGDELFKL